MQEVLTRPIEVPMQVREERDGFAGENRAVPSDHRCADLRAFDGWSLHAVSARPASVRLRALSFFRTARVSHASAFEGLFWHAAAAVETERRMPAQPPSPGDAFGV